MGIDEPRLGIFIPKRNVFSESFIGSHIDGLFDAESVRRMEREIEVRER